MNNCNHCLEILLRLEGLVVLRKGLEQASDGVEWHRFDFLDKSIGELRRQLPDEVLSKYDRLARKHGNTLTMISDRVCQGCHRQVSPRFARLAAEPNRMLQCEHCGRLIFTTREAPTIM
jgi:predicted  nucleic acid-binding Zn-ribbon protein